MVKVYLQNFMNTLHYLKKFLKIDKTSNIRFKCAWFQTQKKVMISLEIRPNKSITFRTGQQNQDFSKHPDISALPGHKSPDTSHHPRRTTHGTLPHIGGYPP
jgi:hypothetical protein